MKLLHIGLGDVTPSESLKKMKGKLIQNGYDKCDEYIRQLKEGTLTSAAGQSEEETLEGIISPLKFFRENKFKILFLFFRCHTKRTFVYS